MTRTHEVLNQATPLCDYDVFGGDRALGEAVEREGAGWAAERLHAVGKVAGGEAIAWGVQANKHPPELRTHDRFGHRIDEVEYPPGVAPADARSAVGARAARRCRGASRAPARTWRARRCSSC